VTSGKRKLNRSVQLCADFSALGRCALLAAMIVLYEHPLSPFAQKVKMALYEKGVDIVLAGIKKKNIRFSHELG
jgi:hypothetical protein